MKENPYTPEHIKNEGSLEAGEGANFAVDTKPVRSLGSETKAFNNRFDLARASIDDLMYEMRDRFEGKMVTRLSDVLEEFERIYLQILINTETKKIEKFVNVLSRLDGALHKTLTRTEGLAGGYGVVEAYSRMNEYMESVMANPHIDLTIGDVDAVAKTQKLFQPQASTFTLRSEFKQTHAKFPLVLNEIDQLYAIYFRQNFRAVLHMQQPEQVEELLHELEKSNELFIEALESSNTLNINVLVDHAVTKAVEVLQVTTREPDTILKEHLFIANSTNQLHRALLAETDDLAGGYLEDETREILQQTIRKGDADVLINAYTENESESPDGRKYVVVSLHSTTGFDLGAVPVYNREEVEALLRIRNPDLVPTRILGEENDGYLSQDIPSGADWYRAKGFIVETAESHIGDNNALVVTDIEIKYPYTGVSRATEPAFNKLRVSTSVLERNKNLHAVSEAQTKPLAGQTAEVLGEVPVTGRLSLDKVWVKQPIDPESSFEYVLSAAKFLEQRKPLSLAVFWHNFIKSMRNRMPEEDARTNLVQGIIESAKNENVPAESLETTLEPGQNVQSMSAQALDYLSSTRGFNSFPWAKDYQGLPDQLEVAADQASAELIIEFNEVYREYAVLESSIHQLLGSYRGVLTDQERRDFDKRFIYLKSGAEVIYKTEPNVHQKIKELKIQTEYMRGLGGEIVGLLRSRNAGENEIVRKVTELLNVEKAE